MAPNQEAPIKCPQCGTGFIIRTNEPTVLNTDDVSAVISSHVDGVTCPECGTRYVLSIMAAQVRFGIVMAADQRPKNGVIIPAGRV